MLNHETQNNKRLTMQILELLVVLAKFDDVQLFATHSMRDFPKLKQSKTMAN
jgi:hypothetical protein